MIKRAETIRLGGFFVFPGGMLDASDSSTDPNFQASSETSPSLEGIPTLDLTALKICALRETYEETGILLGELSAPQHTTFLGACSQQEVYPNLAQLQHFFRILTPISSPLKYDTTFFLAEVHPDVQVNLNLEESSEFCWVEPLTALNMYLQGNFQLMPPQVIIMSILAHFADIRRVQIAMQTMPYTVERPEFLAKEKHMLLIGDYRHSLTTPETKALKLSNYLVKTDRGTIVRMSPQVYPALQLSQFKLNLTEGLLTRVGQPNL
jgi:8-oxo-dGTP pyrophosphatase MutT (NUDIX family)